MTKNNKTNLLTIYFLINKLVLFNFFGSSDD